MQEVETAESGVLMITLSVKPYGFASSPEGGAFWHLPVSTNKAPPSGELDATNGSGLRGFSLPQGDGFLRQRETLRHLHKAPPWGSWRVSA